VLKELGGNVFHGREMSRQFNGDLEHTRAEEGLPAMLDIIE
jgi:hypothetical protein